MRLYYYLFDVFWKSFKKKSEDQVNDKKDAHKEDIGQSKSEDTSEGN